MSQQNDISPLTKVAALGTLAERQRILDLIGEMEAEWSRVDIVSLFIKELKEKVTNP